MTTEKEVNRFDGNHSPDGKTFTAAGADKTCIKGMALGGHGAMPACIDVKDGRVIRIRPFHFDWKYDREALNPWKMETRGKVWKPTWKVGLAPFSLAYKKRVYSPNRIKYPLKRVDWNPGGERNTQNRGKSKYRRISWDEAIDIVAGEIRRIIDRYGPYAILAQADGHAESKIVHAAHGCQFELMKLLGGCTLQVRNPDSWEGWYWGAKHVWGLSGNVGVYFPLTNLVKDICENSELLLMWGADTETTCWAYTSGLSSLMCYFWSEIGIKQIYISPDLNYGAAVHADKWIPILPNTDAALQLAIIYTWLVEDTWDKEYVATHAVGLDKVADYVLGKEDGIPKTPAWASAKCGVPEWTIKALARDWAKKTTTIEHSLGGGFIRSAYSSEPARLECIMLGMQGLGKPGVHQHTWQAGLPRPAASMHKLLAPNKMNVATRGNMWHVFPPPAQCIPKTLIQKAILSDEPISWYGSPAIWVPTEDQFKKYTYPIPEEQGGSQIHMIWSDTPCRTTCWNAGNETVEAFRSPRIETIIVQHPWLENDTLMADVILPVSTKLEQSDFGIDRDAQYSCVYLEDKSIEPVGEAMSDYEIVCAVAKKLGLYEPYTQGKSVQDWIKVAYENAMSPNLVKWDDLVDKKYFPLPTALDWEDDPAGMRQFADEPEKYPLETPSGKLEFYSARLAEHFPDDMERPPVPHWIEKSEMHDERLSSPRAEKYPLLMMSNHGRWRHHAQGDDISWTREIHTCKVRGTDGYMYEPLWINPGEAARRGIQSGDIVKVFNERGTVLCGAFVTERVMPRVAYVDHGARVDWIIPGQVDRGGAINLICPSGIVSRNCAGEATSSYLVQVEKLSQTEMEEWRRNYPEAFSRDYNPSSGLRFNAWVEDTPRA
ncbi:MAG: molybdopterin-dependent oxidoreductase [Dehalococcoidales bacterium]|nr:molybdopterin-dependent oxidoreductase [Dehalococcoidales bacterium]